LKPQQQNHLSCATPKESETGNPMMPNLKRFSSHAAAFRAACDRYANRPALIDGTTFNELAAGARLIAGAITKLNIGRPGVVALLAHNTPESLVAALGVLHTPHALAFIDPKHPLERIIAMLRAADAETIIVHPQHWALGKASARHTGIASISLAPADLSVSATDQLPVIDKKDDDGAIIMFTSGSTSAPRACLQSEGESLSRYQDYVDLMRPTRDSRLGVVHHFANSRNQLFANLLCGAPSALFDLERASLSLVLPWLRDNNITSLRLVPSTLRALASNARGMQVDGLQHLCMTGEAIHRADIETQRTLFPNAQALCVYASSEAGPATAMTVAPTATIVGDLVPLGKPLRDKIIAIADDAGNELPGNSSGRIRISSTSICKQFLGDPSSQSNVAVDADGGRTVFLSRDCGKVDTNGVLHFLGRDDAVIKLNGLRVDTLGVETLLLQLPGISEAAVVTTPRRHGGETLAAFVVGHDDPRLSTSAIREHLSAQLLPAIVPTRIAFVETLPRLASGKVDKLALELPPTGSLAASLSGDTTLQTLARIWIDALGHADFGIGSNFFNVGGDSLLAAEVTAAIHSSLNVDLALTTFAATPTLGALLAEVRRQLTSPGAQPLTEASTVIVNADQLPAPTLVAVAGIQGHALRFLQIADALGDRFPIVLLQAIHSTTDLSVTDVVEQHLEALLQRCPDVPFRLIGASYGGMLAFELALRLEALGKQLEWLCLLDTRLPERDQRPHKRRAIASGLQAHQRAARTFRASGVLSAPIHLGLCVEYPMHARDSRDWRALTSADVRIHALPGRHGAFHVAPQAHLLIKLLRGLCSGDQVVGLSPDYIFRDFELGPQSLNSTSSSSHSRHLRLSHALRGTIEAIVPVGHGVEVRGYLVPPPDDHIAAVAVFAGARYLGWSPLLRRRPDIDAILADEYAAPAAPPRAQGFALKLLTPPDGNTLKLVGFNETRAYMFDSAG
jgi:acyl-coenzyme A synthetase/AMP-(fatty) acid ligase/surfactin synthase thioesterase subunit